MAKTTKTNEEKQPYVIGEATPVRIGLIIILIGVIVSGTWWAASVNSKLDSIISFQTSANSTFSELKAKDIALEKDAADNKLKSALVDVKIKELENKIDKLSPK